MGVLPPGYDVGYDLGYDMGGLPSGYDMGYDVGCDMGYDTGVLPCWGTFLVSLRETWIGETLRFRPLLVVHLGIADGRCPFPSGFVLRKEHSDAHSMVFDAHSAVQI